MQGLAGSVELAGKRGRDAGTRLACHFDTPSSLEGEYITRTSAYQVWLFVHDFPPCVSSLTGNGRSDLPR